MAKLNSARPLTFPVSWRQIRIAHISFYFNGVFRPTSVPLFQAARRGAVCTFGFMRFRFAWNLILA